MSDIRWGWLLGSAAVGAALGLLMSSGDARRNPYNGRKKRKVKRQNPADFTDYGLDPSDADFDDKLNAKLEGFNLSFEGTEKLLKNIKESPDDQKLKQQLDALEAKLKQTNFNIIKTKSDITKKEGELLRGLVKADKGEAEAKKPIRDIRTKYAQELMPKVAALATTDAEYKALLEKRRDLGREYSSLNKQKGLVSRQWQELTPNVERALTQKAKNLAELEQLKYERDLEIDEEEDREFEKNKHYAQKALRRLEGHNTHHKVHSAPKRRVRNNK